MNEWSTNKLIAASSALLITLATLGDYFITRSPNWKSRMVLRSFVMPPMMWGVYQLIESKREMYLMIMGGVFSAITRSLEHIPINININFGNHNTNLPNLYLNGIPHTYQSDSVVSEGVPVTQDPSATQHWQISN